MPAPAPHRLTDRDDVLKEWDAALTQMFQVQQARKKAKKEEDEAKAKQGN